MIEIRLPKGVWSYDDDSPLGPPGGFGEVFAANSAEHGEVAVKKLHLTAEAAAHRELTIATDLADRSLTHVIPIMDAGQDAETGGYFVVMPRAEKSLQDVIHERRFESKEAAEIMAQIATGLREVSDIVHRDLKPGNVLLHNGLWKIADFGIARFAENSTSARTLKDCLSPKYGAPEQWRLERATNATDLYALGCIGYALLTGSPPFPGPETEDLHEQHLHAEPAKLDVAPLLRSLLSMLLRKDPKSRPRMKRVENLLSQIQEIDADSGNPTASNALAEAGAAAAEREASAEARSKARQLASQERNAQAREAYERLHDIRTELVEEILKIAPTARSEVAKQVRRIHKTVPQMARVNLGQASLIVDVGGANAVRADAFSRSKWDVIAGALIGVSQDRPKYRSSSSLWFTNLGNEEEYRWYEVSYFASPMARSSGEFQPFAISIDQLSLADEAAARVIGRFNFAFGPTPIDDEDQGEFFTRWMDLLAKASDGKLEHPSQLPLP